MRIRERMLPVGWYPGSASGCRAEIEQFVAGAAPLPAGARFTAASCPTPAGTFPARPRPGSSTSAAKVTQPQVVVVFGGHLGGNSPPLLVSDEAWETPLGNIPLATEFYAPLRKRLTLAEEYPGDNTIEVQLPMVKYFFPNAKVLAVRSPAFPQGHGTGGGGGGGGPGAEGLHPGLRLHRPDPLRPQLRLGPQGPRPRGGEMGQRGQ